MNKTETITAVKERPILFSTPMVKPIMEGRKTVTRRIVKPQPDDDGLWNDTDLPRSLDSILKGWNGTVNDTGESKEFRCPYDAAILWVRETWAYIDFAGEDNGYVYKATDPDWETMEGWKWKPSIFMPRAACRLRLEIKSIGVERLHEITEEDAIREGVESSYTVNRNPGARYKNYDLKNGGGNEFARPTWSFQSLWIKINGAESWNANPWVWRVEFSKL